MVSLAWSDSTATAAGDGDEDGELNVAPVDAIPEGAQRAAHRPEVRAERLRRLLLEARVAQLEAELERARRRRAEMVERYEQVLSTREGATAPVFSWTRRR